MFKETKAKRIHGKHLQYKKSQRSEANDTGYKIQGIL